MHFFHEWSRWARFERRYTIVPVVRTGWAAGHLDYEHPYERVEEWERRECDACGKHQERRVQGSP